MQSAPAFKKKNDAAHTTAKIRIHHLDGSRGTTEVENQIWRAREKAPWRQNSSSSSNERQWQVGLEEHLLMWSSSEGKVMRAVEKYLEAVLTCKWMLRSLERFVEPEDEEVCLRCTLKFSTRGGSNNFPAFFDTSEKKDHLVANRRRWLEHQGERVAVQER